MALIDKIFGSSRTLSDLKPAELRREEILISRRREKLFGRVDEIAKEKNEIFRRGKQSSSPELRKTLAQDFELKTQEQLMVANELTLRSKEFMTVSRLRMVRENSSNAGSGRLNIRARDMARLETLLTNATVSQEMYAEKLDQLLDIGATADREAIHAADLGREGGELMRLWEKVDAGELDENEALKQADEVTRRKLAGGGAAGGRTDAAEPAAGS